MPNNILRQSFFKKWALFDFFRSLQTHNLQKTNYFSGIRTRIVGEEGEQADHLTITSALRQLFYPDIIK